MAAFHSPPFYGYYDYLEAYYESYYERHHNRLINETCHDRSASSTYYNSSIYLNPLCEQIRNKTAYDHEPEHPFPGEYVVPPLASLSFLCCFASVSIAIFFFYQLSRAMAKDKKKKPDTTTVLVSSSSIIFHTIYNIVDPLALWYYLVDYNVHTYSSLNVVWQTFWSLSKISLYVVFSYRYFILYKASTFAKGSSPFEKFMTFGSIIVIIFVQLGLQIAFIVVLYKYQHVEWSDYQLELHYLRRYLDIGWGICAVDFILVGVLGTLIIRNLLQLVVMMDFRSDHAEFSVQSASVSSVKSDSAAPAPKKNRKQMELLEVSTRISVTCLFSMISSFIVFTSYLTIEELEHWHLSFISYTWCVDNVVNMLCLNFSMAFSRKHYEILCQEYCYCHRCLFCCLNTVVSHQINQKHERELEEGQNGPKRKKREDSDDVVHISIQTNAVQSQISHSNAEPSW